MSVFKNNRGSAVPFIVPVIFAVLCLVGFLWEVASIAWTSYSVEQAMQNVVRTAITQNSDESYASKREGLSGAFQEGSVWIDTKQTISPVEYLQTQLSLVEEDDALLRKNTRDKVEYSLSNIVLFVENTQPLDASEIFSANLELDLLIYVNVPMIGEKALLIPMQVTAKTEPKY